MIHANRGLVARFKISPDDGGRAHYSTRPVVAWDDDGYALVNPDGRPTLRRADYYGNFAGVDHDDTVIAVMPAGGWRVESPCIDLDGAIVEHISEPLIGWALCADGFVRPLRWSADEGVTATDPADDERIYHPDAINTPTNGGF